MKIEEKKKLRTVKNEEQQPFSLVLDQAPEQANLQLADPSLLLYYQHLQDRRIFINEDITEAVNEYCQQILLWNAEDEKYSRPVEERQPIKIFVYTYGGDLNACLSLCNFIQMSKTPVYTYNQGIAYSAGAIILLAGHKRFALPDSTTLIHEGSASFSGTADEVKQAQKEYEEKINKMKSFILSHSKIDEELFNKNRKKDWYIRGEQQLECGIIDEIVSDITKLI